MGYDVSTEKVELHEAIMCTITEQGKAVEV
jgi:hypothetical protein